MIRTITLTVKDDLGATMHEQDVEVSEFIASDMRKYKQTVADSAINMLHHGLYKFLGIK